MQLVQRIGQTRNEEAQAAAALAGLEREADRLLSESDIARQELETLGLQRGQVRMSFESVTARLKRLEVELAELRLQVEASRSEESQSKRRGDQLRGEVATLAGRRGSLEGLIREHSYSTDTVRNIFKTSAYRQNIDGMAAIGTLADFIEVDAKYESVVDEFLPLTPECICCRQMSPAARPSLFTPMMRRQTSLLPQAWRVPHRPASKGLKASQR